MNWGTMTMVALGAAVGAPLRYLVDLGITARAGDRFPWGTLAVNLVGSGVFGLLSGLALAGRMPSGSMELLGVGFCGAFTTTSAFAWEVVSLTATGARRRAIWYVVLSVALGLVFAIGGFAVGESV